MSCSCAIKSLVHQVCLSVETLVVLEHENSIVRKFFLRFRLRLVVRFLGWCGGAVKSVL